MENLKLTEEEIKAVQDSIKHWEKDVIKNLRKGDEIKGDYLFKWFSNGKDVKCDGDYCLLCNKFVDDFDDQPCRKCPYYKYYNFPCDLNKTNKKGHWRKFGNDPNLKTAINMRNALARIIGVEEITE